jgi:glycosyltransferase involved in cell wall biosynthesis
LVAGPLARPFMFDWLTLCRSIAQVTSVDLSPSKTGQPSDLRWRNRKWRPGRMFVGFNDSRLAADIADQLAERGIRPQLIHSHFYPCGLSMLELAERLDVPLVHTEHSSALRQPNALSPHLRKRVQGLLERAAVVSAVGQELAESLSEIAPRVHIELLHNPIGAPLTIRRMDRPAGGQLRLLSAGNLIDSKRVDLQLDLVRYLLDRGFDVELRVAGEGERGEMLRSISQKLAVDGAVRFLGNLDVAQLHGEMEQADVFVHTSQTETFGVVIGEALMRGLPVVSTDCGGVTALADDLPGLVVSSTDSPPSRQP